MEEEEIEKKKKKRERTLLCWHYAYTMTSVFVLAAEVLG